MCFFVVQIIFVRMILHDKPFMIYLIFCNTFIAKVYMTKMIGLLSVINTFLDLECTPRFGNNANFKNH